jgi:hypothetical protein
MTRMSRGVSRNCHPKLALHSLHCTGTYALQPHAAPTSRGKRTERTHSDERCDETCVRSPVSAGRKQAVWDRRVFGEHALPGTEHTSRANPATRRHVQSRRLLDALSKGPQMRRLHVRSSAARHPKSV